MKCTPFSGISKYVHSTSANVSWTNRYARTQGKSAATGVSVDPVSQRRKGLPLLSSFGDRLESTAAVLRKKKKKSTAAVAASHQVAPPGPRIFRLGP